MPGLEFDDLRWLNLLWAVAALALLGVLAGFWRQRALARFADPHLVPRLTTPPGWLRLLVRLTLQVACLTLIVTALIHPRWGDVEQKVASRGVDVMVCLDVSRSMLARDIAPNRLERATLALRDDLLPALAGDRIGLIAFAGMPRLKCPLTNDYGFFRLVLDDVDTAAVPRGGSLIGDAIRLAQESFDDKLDNQKLVLLITDGEDQASFPVEAARVLWEERKIPVIVVALGDEREGARIPVRDERGRETYLMHEGQEVRSRANFAELREIANASDLKAFVGVGTRDFHLGEVYQRIAAALQKRDSAETTRVQRPSRYHPFAVAALLLLLWDSFLRDGPARTAAVIALGRRNGNGKEAAA